MTTTIPFSFNTSQQYSFNVDTQLTLNLECKGNRDPIASLFFTDENNNIIPVPDQIVVYGYEMPSKLCAKELIRPYPGSNCYALCWTDTYEISYKGKVILSTETNRSWNLVCPST